MEDQKVLKAFVDDSIRDSIQEMKDSISKDLAELRSMLLEVLGEKATTSFETRSRVVDAKLWQFRGENPEAWIVQAEHYFDFYKIEEDQKLNVASFYLDGEVLTWYQWLFRNNQLIDWPHFADKVRIRFKQKDIESTERRFTNLGQVTYVTDYQNCCEDVLSSFGETDVLFPGHTYAHPQWSNITNSLLPQYFGEQSECKSNAGKVFDKFPDWSKDATLEPHKVHTDSEYSVFRSDVANDYVVVIENKDKNEEEETVTIANEILLLVPAIVEIPPLQIGSTISSFGDCVMFNMQHGPGIAQCLEEISGMLSTCRYDLLMNRSITDHLCGLRHATFILTLHLFPPAQFGLEFPFDPGSSLLTVSLRVTRDYVFCKDHDKFIMSTLWTSCNWFDTGQDAPLLISGDSRRKYLWIFKSNHSEQNLSNFTINGSRVFNSLGRGCFQFATRHADKLCPRYFMVLPVNRKACYILGLTDMLCTSVHTSSLTKVWDPGRHSLVNSYISKINKNKLDGVDISDILLPADKVDTNDSPVEGPNRSWFSLHPTTHDLMLVSVECLSSYSAIAGGRTLSIGFSVGYSYNASKVLNIVAEVHLLVLYASFDAKHEDYLVYFKKTFVWQHVFCNVLGYFIHFVLAKDLISCSSKVKDMEQANPSVKDDQQSSHRSLFLYFYYVVGSAKRPDSTSFLLASTELVLTKEFLIEKYFHVRPVKSRESYIADGLLASAKYVDVDEALKHGLANCSKLAWTCHTLCHVYQCDCCYNEAVPCETKCSTPWSPLSSFIYTHNEGCIALYYLEKIGVKLPCIFTDVILWFSSNLAEQMVVPGIVFRTARFFSPFVCLHNDPIRSTMEILAIPGSSSLLGICYMLPEVVIKNLQVPLPSILYHMARKSHKQDVLLLNFPEKWFGESVTFPSLVWLYSNLEDKVLFEDRSIVVNPSISDNTYGPDNWTKAGQAIGPGSKLQRGQRISQPNKRFIWDPG